MFKNESKLSKTQKCMVEYESVHLRFLKIYIITRSIIIKKPIFYSITKIEELSVYSTLRFNRKLSKP